MIRPASEIEYPPSEALCTKARMIARLSDLSASTENLISVIAERLDESDTRYLAEIERHDREQKQLLDNMRRIIKS